MNEILHFTGFITEVKYKACLTEKLKKVDWEEFDSYIVLGYYQDAQKSQKRGQGTKHKLTNQQFNNDFIKVYLNLRRCDDTFSCWNGEVFTSSNGEF